jgi:hypothetical protein
LGDWRGSLRRTILAALAVWLTATLASAATLDPFYVNLYRRGVAHFDAGDYAAANRELRIAAFGFVDALPEYETAHIYAAVAASRTQDEAEQKTHTQRVIAAERVARTYATLPLAAQVRSQFEEVARARLTAVDLDFLHGARPPELGVTPQTSAAAPAAPQPPVVGVQAEPQHVQAEPQHVQAEPQQVLAEPQQVITPQQPTRPPLLPAPQPARPQPAAQTTRSEPVTRPQPPPPKPPPSTTTQATAADGERAIAAGDLASARSIFRSLLGSGQLPHATALQIGAGLYRSRDFAGATEAFARAGTLAAGEEPYHYYYAVALYETGQYAAAKRELAAALPYIELTADVDRYRAKIEGAIS